MCVNPGQNVTGCMDVVSSQSFTATLATLEGRMCKNKKKRKKKKKDWDSTVEGYR
jgi:hypothetical protein